MQIVLVAGEPSGDLLGAGLIEALKRHFPQARFEGIGGPGMIGAGLDSWYSLERLSVMGLVEVLRHLPGLLSIRRDLYRRMVQSPPVVFIGIDAPDFNLGLERRLRACGITTVHYVSPSVWAWRRGRVHKIARATDLMLTLFPFEADFYRHHRLPVRFTGHPLADEIPLEVDRYQARRQLGLGEGRWLAVLPGSRLGEVDRLGPLFWDTLAWLVARRPELKFMVPCATPGVRALVERQLTGRELSITLLDGRARQAMAASDTVLAASGTVTLEAMLVKRPLVVAYRVAPLTAAIARRLIRIPRFALPNLLADREVVPEFIQEAATVDNLGPALLDLLDDSAARQAQLAVFTELHRQMRRDASRQAAAAVAELIQGRS
ncbi:MAG: lipid-A-disaccharide synthase [Candidatus Competibacteraceae bacterium]|nr:lipid-A-disaccharide synthase [Candidatus Competibacteraceae bacterium]